MYDGFRRQVKTEDIKLKRKTGINGSCKGGLISESFSLWVQSPKKCAQNYPEHLFFWWIELRIVFGTFFLHIFWEIAANVKNFLRLSHL